MGTSSFFKTFYNEMFDKVHQIEKRRFPVGYTYRGMMVKLKFPELFQC